LFNNWFNRGLLNGRFDRSGWFWFGLRWWWRWLFIVRTIQADGVHRHHHWGDLLGWTGYDLGRNHPTHLRCSLIGSCNRGPYCTDLAFHFDRDHASTASQFITHQFNIGSFDGDVGSFNGSGEPDNLNLS
jgi:hypothetical protein